MSGIKLACLFRVSALWKFPDLPTAKSSTAYRINRVRSLTNKVVPTAFSTGYGVEESCMRTILLKMTTRRRSWSQRKDRYILPTLYSHDHLSSRRFGKKAEIRC